MTLIVVPLNTVGRALVGTAITLSIMATLIIVLRIIALLQHRRAFELHDYFAVFAWVFMLAVSSVAVTGSYYGFTYNMYSVPRDQHIFLLKLVYANDLLYGFAVIMFRMSILFLYLKLFTNRIFRRVAWATGIVAVLFVAIMMFYHFGVCIPLSDFWDLHQPPRCGDLRTLDIVYAAANVVFDMTLALMPMPLLWRLRMSTKKKLATTGIFCLSVINVGVNVARIIVIVYVPGAIEMVLAIAEIWTGIFIACLPVLDPIPNYKRFRQIPTDLRARYGKRRVPPVACKPLDAGVSLDGTTAQNSEKEESIAETRASMASLSLLSTPSVISPMFENASGFAEGYLGLLSWGALENPPSANEAAVHREEEGRMMGPDI